MKLVLYAFIHRSYNICDRNEEKILGIGIKYRVQTILSLTTHEKEML